MLRCCRLCPRDCGVDRLAPEGQAGRTGYCRLDGSVRIFRDVLRWDEESRLNPSHQIYFAGCNLKCEFCTVSEWNEQPQYADKMDIAKLKTAIAERKSQGARTVNLLGGEPAVNLHGVLELLAELDPHTTIVWNSNMYYNEIVNEMMAGLIDVCLADFKCGNDECALKLLGSADYVDVVKRNILRCRDNCDMIIRHLIMPGHIECCLKPILEWIAQKMPKVKVSLRGNYVPPAEAVYAPAGYLKEEDFANAWNMAKNMGLMLIK